MISSSLTGRKNSYKMTASITAEKIQIYHLFLKLVFIFISTLQITLQLKDTRTLMNCGYN